MAHGVITEKGEREFQRVIDQFVACARDLGRGALVEMNSRAAYNMARKIGAAVRRGYRRYEQRDHLITAQSKRQGKAPGAVNPPWDPAPQWIDRSYEQFAQNVQVSMDAIPSKHLRVYTIRIKPAARDWRGKSLQMLANFLESPPPVVSLRRTHRMVGYLQALSRGEGGNPKGKRGHLPDIEISGSPIVLSPTRVPVWGEVAEHVGRFFQRYTQDLGDHLGRFASQYGGRRVATFLLPSSSSSD